MNIRYIHNALAATCFALAAVAGLASCSETNDDENEFADWQNKNETYFNNLYSSASSQGLKVIRNWSFNDGVATHNYDNIVVKVLKSGSGSGSPLYTDSVRVHYQGRLIPSKTYTQGLVFDQSWSGEFNLQTARPATLLVSQNIDGFTTALMNMHIGDRWLVYIPYQLGYGTTGSSSGGIPGYSTLVFDITLDSYFRPDATVPGAQAKAGRWITE
jgi:FKBP-type peptidyl-prolyl cis-trans isomerase FklB